MSDAKAKAEARRAKILARAANSKVTAVMPTTEEADAAVAQDDSLYLSIAETKGKDRPLAARRSFISGGAGSPMKEENAEDVAAKKDDNNIVASETASSPTKPVSEDDVSSPVAKDIEETATAEKTKVAEEESSNTPAKKEDEEVVMSSSGKNKITYVKKSLEEIEREVAERTAAFDKKTLGGRVKEDAEKKDEKAGEDEEKKTKKSGKEDAKDGEKKKSDDKKKKENDNEDEAENKKKNALKKTAEMKLKQANQPVEPTSILRLVRLIMIVLLASYTGYRTVEKSRSDALKIATASATMLKTNVEFDEFGTPVHTTAIPTSTASSTETETDSTNRTWAQYFQQRLTRQMECSVSAVSLVWYMARLLSPVVHAQYKQKPKQTKPLEMIMSFFTEGINAFLEGIYGTMGEISLHLFVLVCSVTLFTMYYSNSVPGIENAGHGTSPAIIPNAEL